MEKRLVLFLLLSFAMIFLYSQLMPKPQPPDPAPAPAGGTGAGPAAGTGPAPEPAAGTGSPPVARPDGAPPDPAPAAAALAERDPEDGEPVSVETRSAVWTLSTWGGTLAQVRLKGYAKEPGQDLSDPESRYEVFSARAPGGRPRHTLSLEVLKPAGSPDERLPVDHALWEVAERGERNLTFRMPIPAAGVAIEKEFRFPDEVEEGARGPYHVEFVLRLLVTDPGKAAAWFGDRLHLRLRGPSGVVNEQSSGLGSYYYTEVLTTGRVNPEDFRGARKLRRYPEEADPESDDFIRWIGLRNRFFGTILEVSDPTALAARQVGIEAFEDRDAGGEKFPGMSPLVDFSLALPPAPAEGGAEGGATPAVEAGFLLFVGPMDPKLFRQEPYEAFAPIVDYGFFGPIVRIILPLLGLIRSLVGNWGIAIIVLTLLIRMAMFPLSRRSQVSMQKYSRQMMRLKPKMDALKERYGQNRKKMNEEMMKLYREEGVRVFPAGCLIMFLQMPVFIGLFYALRSSIGLRHSSFLWAADLTAPDRLAGPLANHGIPLLWDPLFLNVFPILMGITWYLSSAMAPKPADPQQAQTMKMMRWMPIIFSLLLYNYAAGLALYMVVSSTWSIFEMKVVKKVFAVAAEPAVGPAPTFRKGR